MYKDLMIKGEVARCLACFDPACTKSCVKGLDVGKALLSLRLRNENAAAAVINEESCKGCEGLCEKACVHYEKPIRIKEIAMSLSKKELHKKDLSIEFCGVKCENPFFLSSSIVASNYEMCARAFEMGWSGIVYKTIGFYHPEEVSPRFDCTEDENRRFYAFKNLEQISEHTVEENMAVLKKLKENYPSKVVVSSIMGQTEDEWTELARLSEEAGADIIECNFSCPHMSADGLGSDVGQNLELVERYTKATRKGTKLPILAKMTPNIGQMELPATTAIKSGADGIAAINTIKSIISIEHKTMESFPSVCGKSSVSGLSGRAVKPIALRFIHDVAKCDAIKGVPLSGMGGIENYRDALDFITLGCKNVQVTTSVMEYGYRIIDDLISGLTEFMAENGYEKLEDLVGAALPNLCSADELDRNSIVYPKFDREKCVNCKRCYISCRDAGHQAIYIDEKGYTKLSPEKCVGCHLCRLVCPVGAIGCSKRVVLKN